MGETAAVLMSLCTTCKDLGIDPQAYLRDVLDRISTHPARRIEDAVHWTFTVYLRDVLERLPGLSKERLAELLPDRWSLPNAADPTGEGGPPEGNVLTG